jgi:hypothetical protein
VVDLKEAELLGFFDDVEDFARTRDETAASARANAFCFFAVVKDGKWYERGEMGWWGIVHDEKNRDRWRGLPLKYSTSTRYQVCASQPLTGGMTRCVCTLS